jgi:hypothetical protein
MMCAQVYDKVAVAEANAETRRRAAKSVRLERVILEGAHSPFFTSAISALQDDRHLYIVLDQSFG